MFTNVNISYGADISVINGDLNLTIATAIAGQEPNSVINETCQLNWTTAPADLTKKITVETDLLAPLYSIDVTATGVSSGDGNSTGTKSLSTTPTDIITGIPNGIDVGDPGVCTVRYEATATVAAGTGNDNHRITFTITDQ